MEQGWTYNGIGQKIAADLRRMDLSSGTATSMATSSWTYDTDGQLSIESFSGFGSGPWGRTHFEPVRPARERFCPTAAKLSIPEVEAIRGRVLSAHSMAGGRPDSAYAPENQAKEEYAYSSTGTADAIQAARRVCTRIHVRCQRRAAD